MNGPGFRLAAWAVLKKELRVLFLSPLATVFLTAWLLLGGLFFYLGVALTGEASLRGTMANLGVTLLFCVPLVTMRSFAEEQRSGTLELLLTAPVPLGALIVGKWAAVAVLNSVLLGFACIWGLLLVIYGDPDLGVLFTSYVGLWLCAGTFAAAGLFASSLTKDQMVAGVVAVLMLLPSWLASAARDLAPEAWLPVLDRLSFTEHLRSFAQGVVDSADLAWFAGVTFVFLFLTWRSLESRRWR